MVGRTNVPQRKAPTINGVVKECVVASGNTIEKGDFVSLTPVEAVTSSGESYNFVKQRIYDASQNLIVAIAQENNDTTFKLHLCGVEGSSFKVYSGYTLGAKTTSNTWMNTPDNKTSAYCDLCIASNGKVICVINNTFYCFSVDTTNKTLSLVYEENIATPSAFWYSSRSIGLVSIVEITSGKFACVCYSFPNASTVKNYFGFIEYDFDETLSFDYYVSSSTLDYVLGTQIGCCDGKLFYLSSSYIYRATVDFTNHTVTVDTSLAFPSSMTVSAWMDVWFNGSYVATLLNSRASLVVYSLSSSSISLIKRMDKPYTNSNFVGISFVGNDILFALIKSTQSGSAYGCFGVIFDDLGASATSSNVLNVDAEYSYTNSCIAIKVNNNIYSKRHTGGTKDLVTLTYKNGELSLPLSENIVSAYDGSASIGFAKTGGVAGDTIQVYTPYQSS